MNINKRIDKDGNVRYQFRVLVKMDAQRRQTVRAKTWVPPQGMSEKAAEKEAYRQAILFENEVKSGRAELTVKTRFVDVAKEYIKNTEQRARTKLWYQYMLNIAEKELGNAPISHVKAYQIERIYADMREPDAVQEWRVTALDGAKLKAKRIKKGLTQETLAQRAELSTGTIQSAEGGRQISIESAEKIAEAMQTTLSSLFLLEALHRPYSSATINGLHRFFRAVFHYAKKHKLIMDNPMEAVRAPRINTEVKVFSEQESERFYCAIAQEKDIRIKTAFMLLVYTGLRKGELCGLTWDKVDFVRRTLLVEQQLQELTGQGLTVVPLKTRESKAELPIPGVLVDVLQEYQTWWQLHKEMYGDAWRGQGGFVFISDDGGPINPGTINLWLDRLTERNGLPHVTVHSLRHLCAALLIRSGADAKTVQKILRHASITTTCNVYADVFASVQREAIDRVQQQMEARLTTIATSSVVQPEPVAVRKPPRKVEKVKRQGRRTKDCR